MQIILKILPFMFFSLLILLLSPIVLSRRVESSIEMLIYILIFLYATILLLIKESHYVYQCFIHDVCLFLTYYDLFIYFLYFIYKKKLFYFLILMKCKSIRKKKLIFIEFINCNHIKLDIRNIIKNTRHTTAGIHQFLPNHAIKSKPPFAAFSAALAAASTTSLRP